MTNKIQREYREVYIDEKFHEVAMAIALDNFGLRYNPWKVLFDPDSYGVRK